MIDGSAKLSVQRIPLDQLLIGEDLRRDADKVFAYMELLTRRPGHDMEPAIVEPAGIEGLYRIRNGHHRFLASVMAGRPDLLAVVVTTVATGVIDGLHQGVGAGKSLGENGPGDFAG